MNASKEGPQGPSHPGCLLIRPHRIFENSGGSKRSIPPTPSQSADSPNLVPHNINAPGSEIIIISPERVPKLIKYGAAAPPPP